MLLKKYIKIDSSKLNNLIVTLIILINLFLTVFLSWYLNVWIDEAFTLSTTEGNFLFVLNRAINFEKQPPFYFLLLSFWRIINGSPLFARMFSIVCITCSLYVTGKISSRFLKKLHPGILVGVIAFNPLTIYAGVEIRLYALTLLISSLMLLFFYDGYLSDASNSSYRICYILISIVALYTQYFLGFLLVGNAVALLVLFRWQSLRNYFWDMIIVGVCFSPMLLFLPSQLSSHESSVKDINTNTSLAYGIKFLYWRISEYILPSNWQGEAWFVRLLRISISRIGSLIIIFLFIKKVKKSSSQTTISNISIFLVLCIFFLFIRNFVGLGFLRSYHTIILFIPSFLLIFSILELENKLKIIIPTIVVIFLFYSYTLILSYYSMAKPGDFKRVSSYIMKQENLNEPIIFFRNEGILPFKIYYSGINQLVALPDFPDKDKYDLNSQIIIDEKQIIKVLHSLPGNPKKYWFVFWGIKPYLGIDFNFEILDKFIKDYFLIKSVKEFYGSKVIFVEKVKDFNKSSCRWDPKLGKNDNIYLKTGSVMSAGSYGLTYSLEF